MTYFSGHNNRTWELTNKLGRIVSCRKDRKSVKRSTFKLFWSDFAKIYFLGAAWRCWCCYFLVRFLGFLQYSPPKACKFRMWFPSRSGSLPKSQNVGRSPTDGASETHQTDGCREWGGSGWRFMIVPYFCGGWKWDTFNSSRINPNFSYIIIPEFLHFPSIILGICFIKVDVFIHFCYEKPGFFSVFLPGTSGLHDPTQIAKLSAAQLPGSFGVTPGAARDDVQPDVAQTQLHRNDRHGTLRLMRLKAENAENAEMGQEHSKHEENQDHEVGSWKPCFFVFHMFFIVFL